MSRFHDFETGVAVQRQTRTPVGRPVPDLFDVPVHPTSTTRNLSALGQSWEHANLHAEALLLPTAATRGMVRGNSPTPSQAAAVRVLPKLTVIQGLILANLRQRGPMTAKELERLEVFRVYAPSTVRCRVSELANPEKWPEQQALLEDTGEDRNGCAVYRLT